MSRTMSQHNVAVQQALEGNERVYFHPFENLIAVWYGGANISVYNSETWEGVDNYTISLGFREDVPVSQLEDAVSVRMAREGFDRCGRSQDDTRITEA